MSEDPPLSQERFVFSFAQAAKAKAEIESEHNAVSLRVQKILDGFNINGVPILNPILSITRDPNELLRLAKALNRLAPLLGQQSKLAGRLKVIDLAENEPTFFPWAFGDFSNEFDVESLGDLPPDKE